MYKPYTFNRRRPPRSSQQASQCGTDLLPALSLLRHDPELARQVLQQARAGNVHAQYAAGLIYAEGRGVSPDQVEAYVWLSRAMAQGDADAGDLRKMVLAGMTTAELARARTILKQEA